jgi:hypothetical protein
MRALWHTMRIRLTSFVIIYGGTHAPLWLTGSRWSLAITVVVFFTVMLAWRRRISHQQARS